MPHTSLVSLAFRHLGFCWSGLSDDHLVYHRVAGTQLNNRKHIKVIVRYFSVMIGTQRVQAQTMEVYWGYLCQDRKRVDHKCNWDVTYTLFEAPMQMSSHDDFQFERACSTCINSSHLGEAVTTSARFLYKMTLRGIMSSTDHISGWWASICWHWATLNDCSFRGQHSAQELLHLS